MHPVSNRAITTAYRKEGPRWSLGYHTGVDYACPVGTDVLAPISGYIARVAYDGSFGNFIIIRTTIKGVSYNVYLCHLSYFRVKAGQQVSMGQHVAESGNTGNTSGPHLHLEVRKAPYGFNSRDIVDPKVVYSYSSGTPAPTPRPTVLDLCVYNLAHPKWYKPWAGRAAEIKRELWDEASIYLFQEIMSDYQIKTIKEALPTCDQFSGPAGLEIFYERGKYTKLAAENHASGIQGRFAQEIMLKRIDTGRDICVINTHGPVFDDALKERFGVWLQRLAQFTSADIIGGDFNRSPEDRAPKKHLQAIGYRSYKQQADIKNESTKEFIPKTWDLCSIYTRPAGPVDIVGGEVDISTNSLESDHRRIEARIVIAP